ncbi:replication factor C subunit 2/4 [Phakopsora pachyrhizi]|uniref:Replication factor C subunit 2 n=1 Tax=Phakopsora pachyrhizi TaxID=170000 RepID=A0AAV0BDE4_PHAPC|nr:replication factor C subunit 2/4 [Phakopsora pachyrhizi]CAH7683876.1 replication factor C subunit 2/4 [Phakopsora pachyrhizi]
MNAFDFMRVGSKNQQKQNQSSEVKDSEGVGSKVATGSRQDDLPWVEKYRPRSIDSVEGQESTTRVLSKALSRADLPHMLFYGPPGTGKTSTILALARELFGPELMKTRILELNASDERGISVVRDKIKNFAKVSISPPKPGYPCPAFKIIILDEADSMTQDAQSALRRIMETYSKITRFCLICNYVTRIIEPIVSRCSKFRFKAISRTDTLAKLNQISTLESLRFISTTGATGVDEEEARSKVLNSLIDLSAGDLRKSITFLQSLSKFNLNRPDLSKDHHDEKYNVEKLIEYKDLEEIGGFIPVRKLSSLLREVGVDDSILDLNGADKGEDLDRARKAVGVTAFERIREAVEGILVQGYSAIQLLDQLHDLILLNPLITSKPKSMISIVLGEADKALNDGSDEFLQVLNVCLRIYKILKSSDS